MASDYYNARFGDYDGRKRYYVSHPAHIDTVMVAALDENAAMVAAAGWWGERWQDYNHYAYVSVWRA